MFAISVAMPTAVAARGEGEEKGGGEAEVDADKGKELVKLCVEAVIDRTAMDASEYESIKPYYFTPAVVEVVEGGEEGEKGEKEPAKAPVVPNPDGGLEWTLTVTSPRGIVASNHMATLDFEEGVRKVWEGEVEEGAVPRSDRASVLWTQMSEGGNLAKPTFDEEGAVVLPGADAGGKGKKGKGKAKAEEVGDDKPKMPMPEKGEDGAWLPEQLMTVVARSASTLVEIKLEDARFDARKNLDLGGDIRADGDDGDAVLLSEQVRVRGAKRRSAAKTAHYTRS